jgi:uncharacterized Zn ribbon protein
MAKDAHKCPQCGYNLNYEDEQRQRCPNCKYDWRKNVSASKRSQGR